MMNIEIMTDREAVKYLLLLRADIPKKYEYPDKMVNALDIAIQTILDDLMVRLN